MWSHGALNEPHLLRDELEPTDYSAIREASQDEHECRAVGAS